jgi:hypothetical protein
VLTIGESEISANLSTDRHQTRRNPTIFCKDAKIRTNLQQAGLTVNDFWQNWGVHGCKHLHGTFRGGRHGARATEVDSTGEVAAGPRGTSLRPGSCGVEAANGSRVAGGPVDRTCSSACKGGAAE